MIQERVITLQDIANRTLRVATLDDCREAVRMLTSYRRANPEDHDAADVACVLSRVIEAHGWNGEFAAE